MNVGGNDLGNAPGQKVPNDDAAIVATHCQQGSVLVEGTRYRQGDTIQRTIELFRVVLAERFCGMEDPLFLCQ